MLSRTQAVTSAHRFRRMGGWWLIAFIAVVVGFAAILVRTVLQSRDIDWQTAAHVGQSLTKALESDVAAPVNGVDFALSGIAGKLRHPDIMQASADLRQIMLFDRAANISSLSSILVLNPAGEVMFSSRNEKQTPSNHADREYFKHHMNNDTQTLHIGVPIIGRNSGREVLTLSRRLSNSDGSFGGVIVGSLHLDYLKDLFRVTTLGEGGNITLVKTDGTLLMRWPFDPSMIGRDTSRAELFKYFSRSKSGVFETKAVVDGVRRVVAYRQIGDLPLIIGVGQSTDTIFGRWTHNAVSAGFVVVGLCGIALLLLIALYRELGRRLTAEQKFAALAFTDSLTELHNRRSFDQIAEREWLAAMHDRTEIALVMVDVDHFKSINDRLGHRHGDVVLRRVSRAIQQVLRGNDIGARYGGDEFVLLLPRSSAKHAVAVATAAHEALTQIREDSWVVKPNLSFGIAATVPGSDQSLDELFLAADAALYQAKERGRNRIVVAGEPSAEKSFDLSGSKTERRAA